VNTLIGILCIAGAARAESSGIALAVPSDAKSPALKACVACHGIDGSGSVEGAPRLAGQDAGYMVKALSLFKAGKRAGASMQPIARALGDAEMRALSDYFSRQNPPPIDASASASPEMLSAGRALAEGGSANVPACFGCHALQGRGDGTRYPRIGGQPANYVLSRVREFQARGRAAKPQPGTMVAVAAALTQAQAEAVAAYLSKLEP
jgi:cytochrome c553